MRIEAIKNILKEQYELDVLELDKSKVGAGSDTWFVDCMQGRYVLKYPCESEINHPQREPQLCEYLLEKGVSVCQFIKNKQGTFLTEDETGRIFHVQRFMEGKVYELNTAPDWLLKESARMRTIDTFICIRCSFLRNCFNGSRSMVKS